MSKWCDNLELQALVTVIVTVAVIFALAWMAGG
jgi:hypothetical protein